MGWPSREGDVGQVFGEEKRIRKSVAFLGGSLEFTWLPERLCWKEEALVTVEVWRWRQPNHVPLWDIQIPLGLWKWV